MDCHDPHATNHKWVLVKDSQELCMTCHTRDELSDHNHPYDVKPKRRKQYNLRLTEKGKLECLSCHEPHHGTTQHLLRTDQQFTCIGCHEDRG